MTMLLLLSACQAANANSDANAAWSGFLEGKTIDVSPEVGGRITSINVREGEVVQAGQSLAQIDNELVRLRIDAADANIAAADAQLKLLQAGARAEDVQRAQAKVDQARAALIAATQAVTDTEAIRANPQALVIAKTDAETKVLGATGQLTVTVKQAQAADEEANFWKEQNQTLEQGVDIKLPNGSTMHFDTPTARLVFAREQWFQAGNRQWQAWAAVDTAKANQIIAQNSLRDISDQLNNPIALDNRVSQARAARDKAQANLQMAEAGLQILRDGASQAQIDAARAALDQAQAARVTLDKEAAKYTIVAPRGGIVTRVAYRTGEVVAPSMAMVRLSVESDLTLRVFVSFAQVEKIKVGDAATIFVSELNNRKLTGVVSNIADRAEFSGRQAQTDNERNAQLVAVEIAVKDADEKVKAGMPASAVLGNASTGIQFDLPGLPGLPQTPTYSGSLENKQTRIASEMSARAVNVRVKRGDVVNAGDVVVELDDATIKSSLNEASATVRAAQSNLAQVNEPARPGNLALAEAGVTQAKADVQAANAALDSINRTLKTPQDILTQLHIAEGRLSAAQGDAHRAEATLAGINNQVELAAQDQSNAGKMRLAIVQRQQEGAQASLLAAQAVVTSTQKIVDLYRQMLNSPLELLATQHSAEQQVRIAEAGQRVAQAELDIAKRGPQKESVVLAEAKLRAAQASEKIVQAQAKRFALTAPIAGQVVGRSVEMGETVRPGAPLITLADTRELEMTVYVPIRNIGAIKVGQSATLKSPSVPGKSFNAQVTYIAPEAEFKPANIYNSKEQSEMVFAVRVTLANANGELKAGLPADVSFQ